MKKEEIDVILCFFNERENLKMQKAQTNRFGYHRHSGRFRIFECHNANNHD